MTGWFAGCKTIDEVRNLYFRLAKIHHPDVGGSTATMSEINVEYERVCSHFGKPRQDFDAYRTIDEELREVLIRLVSIPGIKVEVCGLWIWVSGNTKAVHEQLKAMGLHYAWKKQMWYYAGVPASSRRNYSMDQIRHMHGSKVIKDETETAY